MKNTRLGRKRNHTYHVVGNERKVAVVDLDSIHIEHLPQLIDNGRTSALNTIRQEKLSEGNDKIQLHQRGKMLKTDLVDVVGDDTVDIKQVVVRPDEFDRITFNLHFVWRRK
jgi:hypothetical protein